jgi:hypothetical protein
LFNTTYASRKQRDVNIPSPLSRKPGSFSVLAGLLTYPGFRRLPIPRIPEQWQVEPEPSLLSQSGITAAGTVTDSNRIPYY